MKTCTIFAGGDTVSKENIDYDKAADSLVICADKGFALAQSIGVKVDIVMGDFDSYSMKPEYADNFVVLSFPPEKDDTDLMLAIKEGFNQHCSDFTIYGALGGRFDHTIASVQSLAYIVNHGGTGRIISDTDRVEIVPAGKYEAECKEGTYFSLFAYSDDVQGLTVKGTKYNVENAILKSDFPLGVSNEIIDDKAEISFEKGLLMMIYSQKN